MAAVDMKPIDIGLAKLRFGERIRVSLLNDSVFEGVFAHYLEADEEDGFPAEIVIDERPYGVAGRALDIAKIASIEIIGE